MSLGQETTKTGALPSQRGASHELSCTPNQQEPGQPIGAAAGAGGVIWNAFGLYHFIRTSSADAEALMLTGMSAAQADLYAGLPAWMAWAFGAGVFAAFGTPQIAVITTVLLISSLLLWISVSPSRQAMTRAFRANKVSNMHTCSSSQKTADDFQTRNDPQAAPQYWALGWLYRRHERGRYHRKRGRSFAPGHGNNGAFSRRPPPD